MNRVAGGKLEGGCGCGSVRYRLESSPLIVHACHCRNCQRQTGGWHAVNALIESELVTTLSGNVVAFDLDTPSGAGQTVYRCSQCQVAVWSNYHRISQGHGDILRFIRVGTLDEPDCLPPDVHIYAQYRNRCAAEPAGVPAFDDFYDLESVWKTTSLRRLARTFAARQPRPSALSGNLP